MRLLICGDIVGRRAREAVAAAVPRLRRELHLDFVIVNGENAAHGFGITESICAELYAAEVDVITTGNHIWDRREIMAYIDGDARLIFSSSPWRGRVGTQSSEARCCFSPDRSFEAEKLPTHPDCSLHSQPTLPFQGRVAPRLPSVKT